MSESWEQQKARLELIRDGKTFPTIEPLRPHMRTWMSADTLEREAIRASLSRHEADERRIGELEKGQEQRCVSHAAFLPEGDCVYCDWESANQHIAECQEKLDELEIQCGADGSVTVGIDRLQERVEGALATVCTFRDRAETAEARIAELEAERDRLKQLSNHDLATERLITIRADKAEQLVTDLTEALAESAERYHRMNVHETGSAHDRHYGDWDTCNSLPCRHAQFALAKAAEAEGAK